MRSGFITLLFIGLMLFTQTSNAENADVGKYSELLRSDLKTQKIAVITEALDLTSDQGDKFWPIYREYDKKLSRIVDSRIANIKAYAADYNSMTNEKATALVKEALRINHDRYELQRNYYKKIAKANSPIVAARFLQVETLVNNLVDLQISLQLPLVPKLVTTAPKQQ